MDFDAIVVGSGISGGWVAKELCERGLRTLMIERGRHVNHRTDYLDFAAPWELPNRGLVPEDEVREHYAIQSTSYAFNAGNKQFWVKDSEHPYLTPEDRKFNWLRGYHLGGRSLTWSRQTYRMSDVDFEANKKDGHGVDWPIRYADLSPWYDRVESFAGISGSNEGLEQLPDGIFMQPLDLNCAELEFKRKLEKQHPTRRVIIGRCANLSEPTAEHVALGRGPCQLRSTCSRGCGYGAYFSTLSARCRQRSAPETSRSSPTRSSSGSTTTMPSDASRACASSMQRPGSATATRRAWCSSAPRRFRRADPARVDL